MNKTNQRKAVKPAVIAEKVRLKVAKTTVSTVNPIPVRAQVPL